MWRQPQAGSKIYQNRNIIMMFQKCRNGTSGTGRRFKWKTGRIFKTVQHGNEKLPGNDQIWG